MSGAKRDRCSPDQIGRPGKMQNLQRTPTKATDPWTQQTELIKSLFDRQSEEMKQAEERQAVRIAEAEERIKAAVDQRVTDLEHKVEEVQRRNEELTVANKELTLRITQLERDSRRTNFIATGIEFDTPNDGFKKLNEVVRSATNGAVSTDGIRTFTLKDGSKKIVAKCRTENDKRILFAQKKSLSTLCNGTSRPIYLNNDLPREDREAQWHLRRIAKEKRAEGIEVRVAGNRISIGGKWFEWNTSDQKLNETNFRH